MSKELTKKIIEAGIVPEQAVRLMKMWGSLDDDLPESGKQERTENELLMFVAEIGALLARDQEIPEVRESIPDIGKLFEARTKRVQVLESNMAEATAVVPADMDMVVDRLGHFIFRGGGNIAERLLRRGNIVSVDGEGHVIEEVCPIYEEDIPLYFMCTVSGGQHAEMQRV